MRRSPPSFTGGHGYLDGGAMSHYRCCSPSEPERGWRSGDEPVARSAVTQARQRVGAAPVEWSSARPHRQGRGTLPEG